MGDTVSKAQDQSDADYVRKVDASTQTPRCLISIPAAEPDTILESPLDNGGTGIEDGHHAPPPADVTAQLEVTTAESEGNYEPVVVEDYGIEIEDGHHILPPADVTALVDVRDIPIRHAPQRRFKPNSWSVEFGDDGEEAERMPPVDFEFLNDYELRLDEYHIMIVGRPKKDKQKKNRQYWKRKEPVSTASAQSVAYSAENDPFFFEGDPVSVNGDPSNNTALFNGTSAPKAQNTPELDPFEVPTAELTQKTRDVDPFEAEGIQCAQNLAVADDVWPEEQPRDAFEDYWPEEDESYEENFRPAPLNTQIEMCQFLLGEEYSVVVGGMFGPNEYLVHLSENASLYYEVQQALWPFYDRDKRSKYALKTAGRLSEGVFCVVVDSSTYEQPCRAFVQRYNDAEGTADVVLLDMADKEVVPIEDLVQLDERFADTPISAVRVVDPHLQQEIPEETRCIMRVIALKTNKLEVELRPRER